MNSRLINIVGVATVSAIALFSIDTINSDNHTSNTSIKRDSSLADQHEMALRMKHLENTVNKLAGTVDTLATHINSLATPDSLSGTLLSSNTTASIEPDFRREPTGSEQNIEDSVAKDELISPDASYWQEKSDEQHTQKLENEIQEIFQRQGYDSASIDSLDCRSSGCLVEVSSVTDDEVYFDPSQTILALTHLPEQFSVSPSITDGDAIFSKIFLEY